MTKVKIVDKSEHGFRVPEYSTENSAGMDLRSNDNRIVLMPGDRKIIKTGLFIELPKGTEAQIRPRSGMAAKHGVTVLNSPGTIDADYRGEIGVILINHGNSDFEVNHGDRIAQMVIARHETAEWDIVKQLGDTDRGTGGFGSTGKQ